MKGILILFFICISAVFTVAEGQYIVYFSQGTVSKKGSRVMLKKGDALLVEDVVNLGNKSKLVLVCANFKVIQITRQGKYPLRELQSQCINTPSGYSAAYFEYVWHQFNHPHGTPDKNPEAFMKNVGAVSRGCNEMSTSLWLDTLLYGAGSMPVQWKAAFAAPVFAIYQQPFDGAPMITHSLVTGQAFDLKTMLQFLRPGEYYWLIQSKEPGACERRYLKVMSKTEYTNLLTALKSSVPETTAAETAFATGFLLQENHLLADAFTFYSKAAKLEPGNEVYQRSLSKFYDAEF